MKDISTLTPVGGAAPVAQQYGAPVADPIEVARVWLRALGRKVEVEDLTNEPAPHRNQIIRGADAWLVAYKGDFEFLLDLKDARGQVFRGQQFPTLRQAKGILNCLRAEMNREARTPAPAPTAAAAGRMVVNGRPALDLEDTGVYKLPDGTICKVQANREKTKVYAKRLVEHKGISRATDAATRIHAEYQYEAGLVQRVAAEGVKLTLEEAKALTIRYGFCIRCGRHLTDAKSVEAGMGPVCIKFFS